MAPPKYPNRTLVLGPYLVVGQLQGELDERIWAGAALLDESFPEGVEGERVHVHIVCQKGRSVQGGLYHLLALERRERCSSARERVDSPEENIP